jgi:osmotically-inducible protein OsmY
MDRGKMILGVLAAAIAVELCACGKSDQRTLVQREEVSVAPGAGSPMTANAKLEKAVRARFDSDERLKAAHLNVNADVTKNEVTLSGTVDSEALRARAVELAKTAHVGVIVTDKIIVKPRQSNSMPTEKTTLV